MRFRYGHLEQCWHTSAWASKRFFAALLELGDVLSTPGVPADAGLVAVATSPISTSVRAARIGTGAVRQRARGLAVRGASSASLSAAGTFRSSLDARSESRSCGCCCGGDCCDGGGSCCGGASSCISSSWRTTTSMVGRRSLLLVHAWNRARSSSACCCCCCSCCCCSLSMTLMSSCSTIPNAYTAHTRTLVCVSRQRNQFILWQ